MRTSLGAEIEIRVDELLLVDFQEVLTDDQRLAHSCFTHDQNVKPTVQQFIDKESEFDCVGGRHQDVEERHRGVEREVRNHVIPIFKLLFLEIYEVVINVAVERETSVHLNKSILPLES